ncbi:MAG: lytic transglycosylase domain-containing protein [Pseudomonadota bacterium]
MKFHLTVALAAILAVGPLAPPASAGDFTFKRIGPPAADATRRIDIQITAPPPRAETPDPEIPETTQVAVDAPAPTDQDSWFWSAISPALGRVSGRFQRAAQVAARPPSESGVAAPPLTHLRRIARAHGREILRHSVGTKVSPALVLALISVESGGQAAAVSHKGATGLMQLIPATADRFGVGDIRDPDQNIAGGVAYLNWLMEEFGGDPVLALAGYNAGEGAVRRHGGVPPYDETRAYVPKVMAAWNVARLMCLTPPVMPGDGCVFDTALAGG